MEFLAAKRSFQMTVPKGIKENRIYGTFTNHMENLMLSKYRRMLGNIENGSAFSELQLVIFNFLKYIHTSIGKRSF